MMMMIHMIFQHLNMEATDDEVAEIFRKQVT